MAKPLVIVESPAKARTLARLLGDEYRVEASIGHIRDLPENASEVPAEIKDKPWGSLAIDVENGFRPYYVITRDKAGRIRDLRSAVKDAPEVLLATDPDREGESISWHLREVLKPQVPIRRIVFHEITEEAVRRAIDDSRDIDLKLVDAQESRRIVDRLYGYLVSPVLWKKVQTGLSAGRVQSVAVRLVVEREEERSAFRSSAYWDLEARIRTPEVTFAARLDRIGDARVATGRDFDAVGGLKTDGVRLLDEPSARSLAEALPAALPWRVTAVDERPGTQRPSPPFTTSTLQQEANRKLGFSADRTMSAAQRLFTEGLISYHRTDSTTLSERALGEASGAIRDLYGSQYYGGPRQYRTTVKNAQEAHEAIRPTDFGQTPSAIERRVGTDEQRLYDLVWKRAVASQMADARVLRTSLEITADGPGGPATFGASGKAIQFAGFLRAYVEGTDDPAAELGDQETLLPKLSVGDLVAADGPLMLDGLEALGHETIPPARYTDASLVEAPRGRRDRPAVDIRLDHLHDRAAWVRLAPGQGARAELHGVRGHTPPEGALRRARRARFHRSHRGGPRRDQQGRARPRRVPRRVLQRRRSGGVAGPEAPRREPGADRLPGHCPRRSSRTAARRWSCASGASARTSSSGRARA